MIIFNPALKALHRGTVLYGGPQGSPQSLSLIATSLLFPSHQTLFLNGPFFLISRQTFVLHGTLSFSCGTHCYSRCTFFLHGKSSFLHSTFSSRQTFSFSWHTFSSFLWNTFFFSRYTLFFKSRVGVKKICMTKI